MANTGLLVLTNSTTVRRLLPIIEKHVLKTLYIQYLPEKKNIMPGNTCATIIPWKPPHYAQIVTNIYAITSNICSQLDIRVLLRSIKNPELPIVSTKQAVEILIFDEAYTKKDTDAFIQDCLVNVSLGYNFISCSEPKEQEECFNFEGSQCNTKMYKNVVLGGTFDRLHNGHKIFLTEAVLRCTETLTVGVTDVNMLSGKLLWELIEPCQKRIENVKNFLEDVDPYLTYNVVSISDMYGPTKDDPNFELLVVSEETKRGGDKVNALRVERNLNKLDIYTVKLLADENHRAHEETKISSSNKRIRLLGKKIRKPDLKDKPLKPYIIGLTGGIGSGKSSVAEKLQNLGAGFVNCDKIAHDLYLPHSRSLNIIVEHFGRGILKSDGSVDRKELGNIVFNNEEQLDKLNKLVWPMILEEAKNQINELYTKGFNIVIMEAAVLIRAGWQYVCHEIWTCIVPPEEAIKRVMERNSISEDEAKKRIEAQPSNLEQVSQANVVICTLWSHDFTQEQVQNAWNEVQLFLSQHTLDKC